MNKVYLTKAKRYYGGCGLVAAKDAEEACDFIKAFRNQDPEDIRYSCEYSMVTEYDQIPNLYSPEKGIIWNHIYL